MFKSENEWQKIKQVPISLPKASRDFPMSKLVEVAASFLNLLSTAINNFITRKVIFFSK